MHCLTVTDTILVHLRAGDQNTKRGVGMKKQVFTKRETSHTLSLAFQATFSMEKLKTSHCLFSHHYTSDVMLSVTMWPSQPFTILCSLPCHSSTPFTHLTSDWQMKKRPPMELNTTMNFNNGNLVCTNYPGFSKSQAIFYLIDAPI